MIESNTPNRVKNCMDIIKEKVVFMRNFFNDIETSPTHGDIRRYRDGIKIGEWNDYDKTNNFIMINDEKHLI